MPKVLVLTTPGCTGCAVVEKMLDELKVRYEVVDVTKNPELLQKHPIMTAPGIVINGKLEFWGVPSREDLKRKLEVKN
ncbi:MAG TPA: thioredoxin family protein [archaeon]|nr:thioredoxin family protein [archaeon]